MKKISKLLSVLLIAMIMISFATTAFAAVKPDVWDSKASSSTTNVTSVENLGATILKVVSTVGSVASVIVLVILGIKYMMGSAEEKAEYKKTLLPYVIGAGLIFAASTIATIVFNFASTIQA